MGELSDMFSTVLGLRGQIENLGIFKPRHSSISASAMEGTANFPVLVSDSVPVDDATMIAKSLEQKFATFLLTTLTMNPYLDSSGTPSAAEYVKQFHQNLDQKGPKNKAFVDLTDPATFVGEAMNACNVDYSVWTEQAMALAYTVYEGINHAGLNKQNMQFNYTMEEVLTPDVLNTKAVVRPILEKSNQKYNKSGASKSSVMADTNNNNSNSFSMGAITINNNSSATAPAGAPQKRQISDRKQLNYLNSNDFKKANDLVPTMLHVRVFPIDATSKEQLDPIDFVMGVKATLHSIPAEDMVLNIARGLRNDDTFFNFVRWTTGETKFLKDFLFAVDQQKIDAQNASRSATGWWPALRRRKIASKIIGRFSKKSILPNATIVLTTDDIAMLKDHFGINIDGGDTRQALALIETYFLLAFVRVNPALQRVDFLFDGTTQYDTVTYSMLLKDSSADDRKFKDMMKMLGRGV